MSLTNTRTMYHGLYAYRLDGLSLDTADESIRMDVTIGATAPALDDEFQPIESVTFLVANTDTRADLTTSSVGIYDQPPGVIQEAMNALVYFARANLSTGATAL